MMEKKRNKKACVLLLTGMLAVSVLQGCNGAEDVGKVPQATTTPEPTTEPVMLTESPTDKPETVTPTEAPILTEPVTPTEAPGVTESVTPTMAPEDEVLPTPAEAQRELPEYTLTVGNELYFEFAYEFEALTFRSENPDVVQAVFMEGEYDWEEERETTGVMLYGIANGETELTVTDVRTGQEVHWTITVEKPAEENGKQTLINWLLANGETNELGDKVLTKGTPEDGGQATVEYATMDKNINFYYEEVQGEEKIEWNLIPTAQENTEHYITMRLGEEFVTATVDLATYAGESVAFEQGWFGIPVEADVQKRAEEASGRAYEAVSTLLYEETGMKMGETVR